MKLEIRPKTFAKISFGLILLTFALNEISAQSGAKIKRRSATRKTTKASAAKIKAQPSGTVKILLETDYSSVEEPFVFVARDAETYQALRKLMPDLPDKPTIDFQSNVIVAAFAGTKPTPGFKIVFEPTVNGVKPILQAPAKGNILAQVLTAPASVAAVSIEDEKSLALELTANWLQKTSVYKVANGKFEASGGFAGTMEKFVVSGTIKILRADNLITAIFDLKADGTAKSKKVLFDAASGVVETGKIKLARVDAGTLVSTPRPPMFAAGEITETRLTLNFEPLPSNVSDGYQGRGTLEAKR